MDLIIYLRSRR